MVNMVYLSFDAGMDLHIFSRNFSSSLSTPFLGHNTYTLLKLNAYEFRNKMEIGREYRSFSLPTYRALTNRHLILK